MIPVLRLFAIATAIILLPACSRTPGDDEAIAMIEKSVAAAGLVKASNIKRNNGWETGEKNYSVEYGYDLAATQDFKSAVLALAAKVRAQPGQYLGDGAEGMTSRLTLSSALEAADNPSLFGGVARFSLNSSSEGKWLLAQGQKIRNGDILPVFKAFLATPAAEDKRDDLPLYLLYALSTVNDAGYQESTKPSQVLGHVKWVATFQMTEKGWQLTNQ